MEIKIDANKLRDELAVAVSVLEKKSTIPVLSNLVIDAQDQVSVKATDLDCNVRTTFDAEVKSEGMVCVPGRKLFDVVRTLDGEVSLKSDGEAVRVACGRAKFRIGGVNVDRFPMMPFGKTTIEIPELKRLIAKTSFAITTDQTRYSLGGAKLIVKDGIARMVTTDQHRLATATCDAEGELDILIPKKALLLATSLIGADDNNVYFESEGKSFSARLLTGSFPNWEMAMPKDHAYSIEVDVESFRNAVKRIALVADERNQSVRVAVADNELLVMASTSEEEGSESFEIDYSGEAFTFGFNYKYLLDALSVSDDTITWSFKDANNPCSFTKDSVTVVVMPLRV